MSRQRVRLALPVLGLCTAGAVGLGGAPATAAPSPTCGATITTSVTLTDSLSQCREGLKIGADNVVVDLGGNTVGAAWDDPGAVGIDLQGHRNVTVRNGGISDYRRLVDGTGAHGATLRNLTLFGAGANTVELSGAADAVVVSVELTRLRAEGADRLRIAGGAAGQIDVQGQGIRVQETTVQGLAGPDGASVSVRGDDAQVLRLGGSNVGVLVVGDRARVEGVGSYYDSGFLELRGNDGIVRSNSMVEASHSPQRGAAITVVGDRNQLIANQAVSNAGTGIHVEGEGNALRRNVALANTGHGIESSQPTVGSNVSRANQQAPQCVNVRCTEG